MAKTRLIASSPALEKKLSSLLTKEPSLSNEPPSTKINQRNNDINILSSLKIKVFNATGSDIARFEAVALNGNYMPADADDRRDVLLGRFDGIAIFNAKKASDDTLTWGIAQDDIPNETFGEVVIQGTTPAFFTGETGDYVVPAALGLVRSAMGPAKVIALPYGDYPGIINIGGSGGTRLYQFQVIDASETASDGTVTLKIRVQNGHNPKSGIAGYLNGTEYIARNITLAAGTSPYYVYALNGVIRALNHTFQSDFFPVLRLATVTVVNSKLTITQENFQDDPTVPVCDSIFGATTLTGTVNVENYTATASYKVAAKGMLNNIELNYQPTENLPTTTTETTYKYLLAYIKKINVENDAAPVADFEISSSDTPSTACEWHEPLLQYSHTAESFHVKFRSPSLHLFTFTTLYLNHNEASDD